MHHPSAPRAPRAHRTLGLIALTTLAAVACDADRSDEVASEHGMLFANTVSADAPVGYWKLAERSGTVAADSSGKGANGTYAGGVALGQAGALADSSDTAALFDGVSGRVEIPDAAALRLDGSFSIEFFAKSSGSLTSKTPGILRKGDAASGTGYLVDYDQMQRPVWKRAGIDGCRVSKSAKLSTSRYKHYVLTYDAATRTPRWYVNGALDTTCAPATYPIDADASMLTLGRADVFGKTYLDEVAFYDAALAPDRVRAHYQSSFDAAAPPPTTGMPDLVVTAIAQSPATPAAGDAVTFSATIENRGAAATPDGTILGVAFSVDGTLVTWSDSSTASLAAGASRTVTANSGPNAGASTWSATSGTHTVEAWVDDVDRIPESDEANNQLSETLSVGSSTVDAGGGGGGGGGGSGAPLYGYSAHILWQSDSDAYADFAMNGGATTERDDVSWAWIETSKGNFDWTETDRLVTYCATRNMHLLMMVGTAPAWASGHSDSAWYLPVNASDYGNFVQAVAKRYGANGAFWSANPTVPKVPIAGIEIWNEPNLAGFSQAGADPLKYAAMLKDAYPKIKAADPSITVVAGALAPAGGYDDADCNGVSDGGRRSDGSMSGLNFLSTLYANGVAGSFDAISYHPYNFWTGATATQMLSFHVCSAWSQVEDTNPSVRSLMMANGDGAKRVWATETGAPTCISGATYPCVSEAEQANFATQAMAAWKARSYSGNFYWYDLRDDRGGDATNDMEEHFGSVRANGSLKPSYSALKTAWAP